MSMRVWIDELSDEASSAWAALRTFWTRDLKSIVATLGIFLVFSAPLIVVILILWYLDATGWRSGSGFYTIG